MTQAEFTRQAQAVFDAYVARLRGEVVEVIDELVNRSPKKGQTRAVPARRGAAESKSDRRSPRRPGRARVAAPLRAQARVASSAAAPAPLATSTDPSPSTDHPATYGVGSDGHRLDSTPPKADVELAPVAARGAELGRVVVASAKVHRCGRCGGTGHNRRTCPADAPAESEPSSPTASADPPELGAGAEQDDEGLELDQVDDVVDAGAEHLDAPTAPAPRPRVASGCGSCRACISRSGAACTLGTRPPPLAVTPDLHAFTEPGPAFTPTPAGIASPPPQLLSSWSVRDGAVRQER